jgi:type I restriction enzyme M protein
MTISDPACGTGGFLLAAYNHIVENNPNMDRDEKEHLRFHALKGVELVDSVTRLCAMNLSLHGIGNEEFVPVRTDDSLRAHPGEYFDMVLANPPFGTKSAITIITGGGETAKQDLTVERDDFWTSTSNKQLMFLQHIVSTLKVNGSAAVVLPDNVLFESGPGETVRRKLMQDCNLHTIIRLPTGLFYAQGVRANVLFFTKGTASADAHTKRVWFYDLRTNKKFTLKQRPLTIKDLEEFISLYKRDDINNREVTWSESNEEGRWRSYSLEEILARDKASLDIFWLKDDKIIDLDNLPDPVVIADEIVTNLEEALSLMNELRQSLGEQSSE